MDRAALPCPRLRPGLAAFADDRDPAYVIIHDQLRLTPRLQRLTLIEFDCVQLFDGRRSLRDIQMLTMQRQGGQLVPLEMFIRLIEQLDELLFLDTPRYRERLTSPVREPSCIGCYEGEPEALRRQLRGLFTGPAGPGLPREGKPSGRLRAALLPHIDFQRGGHLRLGLQGGGRADRRRPVRHHRHVALQRAPLHPDAQDFQTPLGIARTDQAYIDRLVRHYGDGLFDDELAHLPEHSIELEVVFLQYLYEGRRPFRIVPLVVGSFDDCVAKGKSRAGRMTLAGWSRRCARSRRRRPSRSATSSAATWPTSARSSATPFPWTRASSSTASARTRSC